MVTMWDDLEPNDGGVLTDLGELGWVVAALPMTAVLVASALARGLARWCVGSTMRDQ